MSPEMLEALKGMVAIPNRKPLDLDGAGPLPSPTDPGRVTTHISGHAPLSWEAAVTLLGKALEFHRAHADAIRNLAQKLGVSLDAE